MPDITQTPAYEAGRSGHHGLAPAPSFLPISILFSPGRASQIYFVPSVLPRFYSNFRLTPVDRLQDDNAR